MKTGKQMFGKLARDAAAMERALKEDAADRYVRAMEEEAHQDAPISRRDVLDALETAASEYGCAGNHDSDLIADAFRKLAKALS